MFDIMLSSSQVLEGKYNSIHDMIFSIRCNDELAKPIIVGANALDDQPITLQCIQNAVYQTQKWCDKQQIIVGDTVALLRFPRTSEVPLALSLLAFLACGIRVYLPENENHLDFLTTSTKAIIGYLHESPSNNQDYSLPLYCIHRDLKLFACGKIVNIPVIEEDQAAIVFTTSGSTGLPKLVLYTHKALINCGKAWEMAGLFSEKITGGTSLCPTLSHTMGVRNLLGALWTRRSTLFIYREWFNEPQKIEKWLLKYPPQHITCGSALFFMLHKCKQQSPALRSSLKSNLRCIVASGCKVAENLRQLFPDVVVANAFGTTETQQVMNSTLLAQIDHRCLGKPLPGVQIAINYTDSEKQHGRLFVNSPFASQQYLNDKPFSRWIETGDIVEYKDGKIYFVARENPIIMNNGLGLKLSMSEVEEAYTTILPAYSKIFDVHPKNPGIIALVFIPNFDRDITDVKRQMQSELEAFFCINRSWRDRAPLTAVGIVSQNIPISSIGKVNSLQIKKQYADFVEIIADEQLKHPDKIFLDSKEPSAYHCHMPKIGRLLETLNLTRKYVRGDGNYLYTEEGQEVLDVVGGFSCNLLGYNNEVVRRQLQQKPQHIFLDQANVRSNATFLSKEIAYIMAKNTGKSYVACWASTGSEAVEIAIKHAWFEKQKLRDSIYKKIQQVFVPQQIREKCLVTYNQSDFHSPVIVALRNAFHGRTLGAMSVLSEKKREIFSSLLGTETVFIDEYCDLVKFKNKYQVILYVPKFCEGKWIYQTVKVSRIFAIIVEPIQGEGGIKEISVEFLRGLQQFKAPLILDEIQSGLGRSGQFFASSPIVGDYYILGKALGANLAKISLTLIEKSRYLKDFDTQRTSTFAEDSFSCQIALGVLKTIQRDDIPKRCDIIGGKLKSKLQQVQNGHPLILHKICGRGCMIGVELRYPGKNYLLQQFISPQIGYFCASYLLNHHNIRILPTSSAPKMLRIQPSAYTTDREIQILIDAIEDLCKALSEDSILKIIGHIAQVTQNSTINSLSLSFKKAETSKRVAFIHHPLSLVRELLAYFPESSKLSVSERRDLSTVFYELSELRPIITFADHLHQNKLWLMGIALPAPPIYFKESLLRDEYDLIEQRIQEAIHLAEDNDCKTVIFGGYTSIIVQKSTQIHIPQHLQVSSGNTYTIAIAWNDLQNNLIKNKRSLNSCNVGVVGALGNIGRGYCRLLAQHNCQKLVMIGNVSSMLSLQSFASEISNSIATSDLQQLDCCDIIIVVSNHYMPIVFSEHVSQTKRVFVQDLSQPANVDISVRQQHNVSFLSSGLIRLPYDKEFRLNPSLPRGVCFACTAEGMLLSLSERKPRYSWEIYPQDILELLEEGKKQQLTSTASYFF